MQAQRVTKRARDFLFLIAGILAFIAAMPAATAATCTTDFEGISPSDGADVPPDILFTLFWSPGAQADDLEVTISDRDGVVIDYELTESASNWGSRFTIKPIAPLEPGTYDISVAYRWGSEDSAAEEIVDIEVTVVEDEFNVPAQPSRFHWERHSTEHSSGRMDGDCRGEGEEMQVIRPVVGSQSEDLWFAYQIETSEGEVEFSVPAAEPVSFFYRSCPLCISASGQRRRLAE